MRFLQKMLLASALPVMLAGCRVDPVYDLDHLDPEITVMKTGLMLPLSWSSKMRLDALFQMDEFSALQYDEQGDYFLSYRPDPFEFTLLVSEDGALKTDFNPFTYTIPSLPDAILGDNPSFGLDFSKSTLTMQVESGIPASFTFGIDFETYVESQSGHQHFHYDGMAVAPGTNELVIRDEKLFHQIPNSVKFNKLTMSIGPEQQALLEPGALYTVRCKAVMTVPVAFAAGTEYTFEYPVSLLYDLAGIRVRQAAVDAKIVNTIPVDFEVEALCLDEDKHPVPGVSGRVDKTVPGGTIGSPAETRARATLSSESGYVPGRLTLRLTARVPAPLAGTVLNREQAIQISDMRLSLPEGIQVDLF